MTRLGVRCFVGHVFNREEIDDLRQAIKNAFENYPGVLPWYADEHLAPGHILDKIQEGVDESLFCIFELSHISKPNVFIELGYARGRGKTCVLLVKKGREIPSDLAGLDRIEYESMIQLTASLQEYLPQVMGDSLGKRGRLLGEVDERVMSHIDPCASRGNRIDTEKLRKRVAAAGVSEVKVAETLEQLQSMGYVERRGDDWFVSDTGAKCIPELVAIAKRQPLT